MVLCCRFRCACVLDDKPVLLIAVVEIYFFISIFICSIIFDDLTIEYEAHFQPRCLITLLGVHFY